MDDPKALARFQEILKKTRVKKLPWQPTSEEDKIRSLHAGQDTLPLIP